MIREIVWKEWRENRWKYVTLWLVFNAPVVLLTLALAFIRGARLPFADLTDKTVLKYLPLALGESYLIATLFLLATALVAIATFLPDVGNKVFFVFEQPLSRRQYVAAKLLNGWAHVALAVCSAILLAPAAVYAMMLIGGRVTLAGSGPIFSAIFGAAARALLWCSLVSLIVFTACAWIAMLARRWWLAFTCSIVFLALFGKFVLVDSPFFSGDDFFNMVAGDKTMSVSANCCNGPWLNVTDTFPMPTAFAPWRWLPILTATVLIALFSFGLAAVYERKELK